MLLLEGGNQAGVSQYVDLSDGGGERQDWPPLASSVMSGPHRTHNMVMTTRLVFLVCNMGISPIWERRLNVWVFQ